MRNLRVLVLAILFVVSTALVARSYSWLQYPWNVSDCVPDIKMGGNSFSTRSYYNPIWQTSPEVVWQQLKDAATIWHESGQDLCLYSSPSYGFCYEKGVVCARYYYQDSYLSSWPDTAAYTRMTSWGGEAREWLIIVNASKNFTMSAADNHYYPYMTQFMMLLAHELGHALSLADPPGCEDDSLMEYHNIYAYTPIKHSDDGEGLIDRYGNRRESMKTRKVAYYSGSGLSFPNPTVEFFGDFYKTQIRPAIVGNWWHDNGGNDNWDYAIAWVNDSQQVQVALARDASSGGGLVIYATTTFTESNTSSPPSIAVGPRNRIVVAWKEYGTENYIKLGRLAVNSAGSGWLYKVYLTLQYQTISSPVITYNPGKSRYVLTWPVDTMADRYRIATMVSSNSYGSAWSNSPNVYNGGVPGFPEFLSTDWFPPAFTCYNDVPSGDDCLMLYKQYRTADTQWIDQQGFEMNTYSTGLDTVSTDWSTWNSTYAAPSIASGDNEWIYTHVENTANKSKMYYRVKPYWKGVGGDYRYYTTQSRSDMVSRVGFPIAYNYRNDTYRFLWTEY